MFDGLMITRAGPDDLAPLVGLFDAYRVFYERPSDMDAAREFISERLWNRDSVIFLAAIEREGDKEYVGFTQLFPSFSSVSMKRLWILNDLYVTPEVRGKGVGRALIDRSRDHAADTGAKGLILETAIDNTTAQALYDSYGFERDTEFYRYAYNL